MIVNNIAIEIEGVDKAGKDQLLQYICVIGEYRYTLNARGILSNLVYNEKYGRNYQYTLTYKPLIIYLDVENQDHKIRCKLTHEPAIDIDADRAKFEEKIAILESKGITVLKYNTTDLTPYRIAQDVIKYLDTINPNDFLCSEPIVI